MQQIYPDYDDLVVGDILTNIDDNSTLCVTDIGAAPEYTVRVSPDAKSYHRYETITRISRLFWDFIGQSNVLADVAIGDRVTTVDGFKGIALDIDTKKDLVYIDWDKDNCTKTWTHRRRIQTSSSGPGLEKIEPERDEIKAKKSTSRWNTTCIHCGQPAYDDKCFVWECSKGCSRY